MKQKESLGLCLKAHKHCPKEISVTLLLVAVVYLVVPQLLTLTLAFFFPREWVKWLFIYKQVKSLLMDYDNQVCVKAKLLHGLIFRPFFVSLTKFSRKDLVSAQKCKPI